MSDAVSPERLQRIRELAQKATPGPWVAVNGDVRLDYDPGRRRILYSMYNSDFNTMVCQTWDSDFWDLTDSAESRNIAEYIASVHPGIVLALCEEIEHLREQVTLLNKEVEWLVQRSSKEACPSRTKAINCDNVDPQNCVACWRKAVEEEQCKK